MPESTNPLSSFVVPNSAPTHYTPTMTDDHKAEPLDLDALETTAKAATPGPWRAADQHGLMWGSTPVWCVSLADDAGMFLGDIAYLPQRDGIEKPDAEHIATFDPPTVLALIAALKEAQAQIAALKPTHKCGHCGYPWPSTDPNHNEYAKCEICGSTDDWTETS